MQTSVFRPASTLNEWANFLNVLTKKDRSGQPLLRRVDDPYRMIQHLERKFPVVRKYSVGKQLRLFVN